MAEQQQNQQERPDEELVPINDQVRIGLRNYNIALEKQQPNITPKIFDHLFVTPPPHDDIVSFINELGYSESLEQVSKMAINNMYQPWRTFMTMINKCLTGKAVLGNLKFTNKGEKEPIYQKAILMEMMSDEIKKSADYLDYLAKSIGTKPVKGRRGIRYFRSEETDDEEEGRLIARQTGVVIGRRVHKDSDEEDLDHSKKLKGIETLLLLHNSCTCEGSRVLPEVPDGPSGSSSSSSSESYDSEGFLPTDDEASPDKSDAEEEKAEKEKAKEERAGEEQPVNDQPGKVQAEDHVPEPQVKKPVEQLISSNMTLSSAEYGNQFIIDNPDVTLAEIEIQSMVDVLVHQEDSVIQRPPLVDTVILMIPEKTTPTPKQQPPQTQPKQSKTKLIFKKSKKLEDQVDIDVILKRLTRLETKVEEMSKIDHSEAINKSVQAQLKKVLQTVVPNFGNVIQEKAVKTKMPNYSTKSFDDDLLKEYDMKHALLSQMTNSKSFKTHPSHQKLYDALIDSLLVDEDNVDKKISYSAKNKEKEESSKEGKAPSKSSKTDKTVNTEESVQDDAMDIEELVQDANVDADDTIQVDADPKQDNFNGSNKISTVDFKKFAKHYFGKDKSTKADLEGPAFRLLKGNYKNNIELEYNMEQCYLALTYQIDWVNPEGDRSDFKRLHLNDIEDMYLLYAQNKLHHLKGHEQADRVTALRLFIRSIVLKKRVEDVQLGVEGYQTKLNITRPQVRCDGLDIKEPYTILHKPKGVVYLNKNNVKYLMRDDELYKFSDGTLKPVWDILNTMLHNFELGYNNTSMLNRAWTKKDQKRTTSMLKRSIRRCCKDG
ncbi:hypothetical protein Tco_0405399 [Tanacetum coccineum]